MSIFSIIIVVGIIVWVAGGIFLTYRFLIRKKFVLAILSFIFVFIPVFGSFYITHILSEYASFSITNKDVRHLFTEITGERLPTSAIIVEKEGSNGFLDRYMTAIIRMDAVDYNKIYTILSTDSIYDVFSSDAIFRKDTVNGTIWTTHVDRIKLLHKAQVSDISFEKYKSGYKEIGFGGDKQHIIIKHED